MTHVLNELRLQRYKSLNILGKIVHIHAICILFQCFLQRIQMIQVYENYSCKHSDIKNILFLLQYVGN